MKANTISTKNSYLENLVTVNSIEIAKETIPFTEKVRQWCKLGGGCPNYGNSPLCPPKAEYRANVVDQYNYFTLVYARFDLYAFKAIMKAKHQDWSDRMCGNSRYWQKGVKAIMRQWIQEKNLSYDDMLGCGGGFCGKQSMESAGIFVMLLYRRNHVEFELKPTTTVVLSALLMSKERIKPARAISLEAFL